MAAASGNLAGGRRARPAVAVQVQEVRPERHRGQQIFEKTAATPTTCASSDRWTPTRRTMNSRAVDELRRRAARGEHGRWVLRHGDRELTCRALRHVPGLPVADVSNWRRPSPASSRDGITPGESGRNCENIKNRSARRPAPALDLLALNRRHQQPREDDAPSADPVVRAGLARSRRPPTFRHQPRAQVDRNPTAIASTPAAPGRPPRSSMSAGRSATTATSTDSHDHRENHRKLASNARPDRRPSDRSKQRGLLEETLVVCGGEFG